MYGDTDKESNMSWVEDGYLCLHIINSRAQKWKIYAGLGRHNSSHAPHNSTHAPHNSTYAPHNSTHAPHNSIYAPHYSTHAPTSPSLLNTHKISYPHPTPTPFHHTQDACQSTRSVNKVMRLPAYRMIWQYCGRALHMKVR